MTGRPSTSTAMLGPGRPKSCLGEKPAANRISFTVRRASCNSWTLAPLMRTGTAAKAWSCRAAMAMPMGVTAIGPVNSGQPSTRGTLCRSRIPILLAGKLRWRLNASMRVLVRLPPPMQRTAWGGSPFSCRMTWAMALASLSTAGAAASWTFSGKSSKSLPTTS